MGKRHRLIGHISKSDEPMKTGRPRTYLENGLRIASKRLGIYRIRDGFSVEYRDLEAGTCRILAATHV